MFVKTVSITIVLNDKPVKMSVQITCTPTTPNEELIRRASNMFGRAADYATFEVV